MRPGAALIAAGGLALVVVAAASAVATRRQQAAELSPIPTVGNGGPRGLAAAWAWLGATGRPRRVLGAGDPAPTKPDVLLLVAPRALLSDRDAAGLLAHAERGGLLVWAMGAHPQPALERALGVVPGPRGSDAEELDVASLLPHPLFDGLTLRTGGAALRTTSPLALPVAGGPERPYAVSLPVGAGEAIVLAGPDVLENRRLIDRDDVALLARVAALGPIVFDERFVVAAGAPTPASRRTLLLLVGQALLAAAALLVALGRRLGAVRGRAGAASVRSSLDYLWSLAALYRRAGAERELAGEAWRELRLQLERRAGIPARATVEEAAARLGARRPAAAAALRLAADGREAGSLLAVARAAAALETALGEPRGKQLL